MDKKTPGNDFRCGYAAIIGRPNVGKSTLINVLIGQKISITSRKPQTTQRRLLGIKSRERYQIIYVDTPGMQSRYQDAINHYMRKEISSALVDVDVLLLMVEALKWTDADDEILDAISHVEVPVIALINKIDKVKDRKKLLPYIKTLSERKNFTEILPVSASKKTGLDKAEQLLASLLPEGPAEFSEDQLTDRSERFIVAEFIREKLIKRLGKELPYRVTVTIEKFTRDLRGAEIDAIIWVESDSQKSIVIGKDGSVLKKIGEQARLEMQYLLNCPVFLRTWVKVKKNWSDDQLLMKQLGFDN
ncbi:MAG: GTPase Era [Gammaproteobacteria bacterium]|nr:GTPase Era [Gammaproteobacteria bacterium]